MTYEAWCQKDHRILLPVEEYNQWREAVLSGSKHAIEQYLSNVDREEENRLVNGVFVFPHSTMTNKIKHTLPAGKFDIVTPLTMAVAKASGEAVETLIEHGARTSQHISRSLYCNFLAALHM
jgi:hypothetical protein